MGSPLSLHALLALVATAGAFTAWHWPEEESSDEQILIQGELERVEWREDNWQVSLYKGDDKRLWVDVEKNNELDNSRKKKTYMASKQAQTLFRGLSVLKVHRSLGNLSDLSDFGIRESQEKLRLQYKHMALSLDIGGGTYGKAQTYIRDESQGIHLIGSNRVAGLRHGATGLVERKIFPMDFKDLERATLRQGESERKFVGRKASVGNDFFLAAAAEPDQKLEKSSAWMGRLFRLRMVDVGAEIPQEKPSFVVEFLTQGQEQETVRIWRPNERVAFMQVGHYRDALMVSKHEVQALIDDLPDVFSEGRLD
ncbi:MAG: hypothetical protein CMH60_01360 [Myxococcales bacterium]|nr:hypothetical protein [Myxococcales bacterium]|tara:strand:- start:60 stop:992 length:933 start_codon:yes stop_codon:yes gene_type:complete